MQLRYWLVPLLLCVRYSSAALLLLHVMWYITSRLLQILMLFVGGGTFWWVLRSYQLQKEQELLDHAVLKFKFYRKYHHRSSSNSRRDDESIHQLRGRKRLSVVAHLRTSWHLPSELCDAIAALIELIVQNYVDSWFQAVSLNQDFSTDVKLLLADLLGALASRVLKIDSSQALTIFAKSLELLRLHLGWFREVYAQLADEYPAVFEGDENDVDLLKRQMYVAAFVRKSSFVHPGCVNSEGIPSESTLEQGCSDMKKAGDETYLRHVATQLLTHLKPQLGQEQDTNVFVSMAVNLLREVAVFKILKPLSEYSQPRYANEIVVSCLREVVDEKVAMMSKSPGIVSLGNGVGKVPTMTLNKLRSTSSSLYKASRRSGEHAEAAFQAVVEAVASAASSAAAGAAEMVFEGDDWTDLGSNPFAFGSAVFGASSSGGIGDRKAVPLRYGLDDRLSVAKTAKMMNPRGLIPGGLLSHKMVMSENSRIGAHMDDLMMNAKSNIGSSLNSSIGKVKKRFRTLGNHPMDPLSTPPLSAGAGTAARMIRKPGQLLQKAWKRSESAASMRSSSFDGDALTLTGQTRVRSRTRTLGSLNILESPSCNDEETAATQTSSRSTCMVAVRERVVAYLEKAVADYTKMHDECSETRSSVHSRELYDLLSAMENVLMLGFRGHDSDDEGDDKQPSTPPLSPIVWRRSSVASTNDEATSSRRDSVDTDRCYYSDEEQHDDQYYWEFLARDRPGARMLNAHWRSVASDCEACIPSESFISTRGVQWLLAGIAKGSLGTLWAELYAHSGVTELFYEDFALLLDRSLTDSMLHTLHQLDRLDVSLDVYAFQGSQSDVDQELGVSPPHQWQSGDETSLSAPVCVLERVWETERYVPINGWVKVTDKRRQELPSSEWVWEDDWRLDNSGNGLGEVPDSKATVTTWQYAKTFEDDFHDTEMELDCVRRRRWVRQRCQHPEGIPPSSLQVFPKTIGLSSPLASFAVSNGVDKAKKKEQRCNASSREHKKNGGVKSVMESRLKSFGRVMADTSTRHATLGMTDLDDLQRASTKTLAFMKARASIPSLRRGISSMSMKSPTSDTQSLRAKHSIDENLAVLCDEDRNDGETFCTRCLTALPCCESSECACESCHERVCASCLAFHAFMVYPPPLETSKKARVCGICYSRLVTKYKLRLEAHVGKYLTKESEPETRGVSGLSTFSSFADEDASNGISYRSVSSIGDGGTSEGTCSFSVTEQAACLLSPSVGQDGQNFEITVQVNGDSAYVWHVVRTFHDFEVLEKQLAEKLEKQEKKYGMGCRAYHLNGVDYTEMSCIKPSLKTAAVTALTYKKQLYIVEHFLQQLLACDTLCQSSVLQQFLLLPAAFTMSCATGNPLLSVQETDTSKHVSVLADGNRTSLSAASSTGDSAIDNTARRRGKVDSAEGMADGVGKWQKERWVAADGNSKETKMRVLQKIEVSLFAVLGEVFEFDGIGVVRRQIFSMTRSFIKAFLGASHFRMLERQLLSFTDPTRLSDWINDLRLYIFPDPGSADIVPCPAPDMQVLRKECLEAILASFPSKVLSLFGDTACENASLKLHEFLQHEVFVRNLLFSITDELLLHLFPYSTTFKGMDTPNEIPAAPMPVCSSAAEVATTISKEAVAASIIDGTLS
uniref:RUN domain-containing protein n=1 Tax=Hyaloperonospora arabidopsidis (strain Emoy2) TaxID=559515 RepID=M4BWT0_HYAAE